MSSCNSDFFFFLPYARLLLVIPNATVIISLVIASVYNSERDRAMGKLLKHTTVLILAVLAGMMYIMNEESFLTDQKKIDLFNSYLKRASDPHEKRLRLADNNKVTRNRMGGKLTVSTLKFVDEKYYLNTFSKTYKLLLMREENIHNNDLDRIDAVLYLDTDYGVRKVHEIIYGTSNVRKNEPYWNVLNSLYDNPVNSVKKNIRQISYNAFWEDNMQ
jgi:hypothetical protein